MLYLVRRKQLMLIFNEKNIGITLILWIAFGLIIVSTVIASINTPDYFLHYNVSNWTPFLPILLLGIYIYSTIMIIKGSNLLYKNSASKVIWVLLALFNVNLLFIPSLYMYFELKK